MHHITSPCKDRTCTETIIFISMKRNDQHQQIIEIFSTNNGEQTNPRKTNPANNRKWQSLCYSGMKSMALNIVSKNIVFESYSFLKCLKTLLISCSAHILKGSLYERVCRTRAKMNPNLSYEEKLKMMVSFGAFFVHRKSVIYVFTVANINFY